MTDTQAAYVAAVDERLHAVFAAGVSCFSELIARMRGADPVLVAQRVQCGGLSLRRDPAPAEGRTWTPELHALDSEWYFTEASARALAERFGSGHLLGLGVPTVVAAAKTATLVDRDPARIRQRFGAAIASIVSLDLGAASTIADLGRFDAALVDPPWYAPHPLRWLALAAGAVHRGATVAMVLPPVLQRPAARDERRRVIAFARRFGEVTLQADAVRYETPRFERIALHAAGLTVSNDWRTADLLSVRLADGSSVATPPAVAPAPTPAHDDWTIGSQRVLLSRHAAAHGRAALHEVAGTRDFVWNAISRRDPRVADIDLWTSRSRVARVSGRAAVAAALDHLAGNGSQPVGHRDLVESLARLLDQPG